MLSLIPTPIGNLEDITLRAIRILREADIILAEDTRTTGKLLKHHSIEGNMRSFHMHNEHKAVGNIVALIKGGSHVAMVTDAGTPGISDPGFLLVRECIQAGIEVECLPGATAFVPALVCSGLPSDQFVFAGFLPHKKGRSSKITELAGLTRTFILYESPHRLVKTLEQLSEACGPNRQASVGREISKLHEEHRRGTLTELQKHYTEHPPKGEIVLVVGTASPGDVAPNG